MVKWRPGKLLPWLGQTWEACDTTGTRNREKQAPRFAWSASLEFRDFGEKPSHSIGVLDRFARIRESNRSSCRASASELTTALRSLCQIASCFLWVCQNRGNPSHPRCCFCWFPFRPRYPQQKHAAMLRVK